MINQETQQQIQNLLHNILQKLQIEAEITIIEPEIDDDSNVRLTIETKDSRILIGNSGETLKALNHLLRRLVEKELGPDVRVSVDVNGYYEQQTKRLKEKVGMLAERVRAFRSSIPLEPMTSYERMVVHSMFSDSKDIKTESTGFGRERHVVLSFKDTIEDSNEF